MKKNTVKILTTILVVIFIITSAYTIVNATATKASEVSAKDIFDNAEDTTGTAGTVNKIIGTIITVVQIIGVGVAIIMLIVLAIKYISAAPSDKAEIKKHAVVYVVGAVVLFAASGILGIIKNLAKAFTESGI